MSVHINYCVYSIEVKLVIVKTLMIALLEKITWL